MNFYIALFFGILFINIPCLYCKTSYNWNILVKDGLTATLNCSPSNDTFKMENVTWILPDMAPNQQKILLDKDNSNKIQLRELNSNGSLTITNINSRVYGIYICAVKTPPSTISYFKWGLNTYGPPVDGGIENYGTNIMKGAIPAGSFVAIVIILIILYILRYERRNRIRDSNKTENELDIQYDIFRSSAF